MKDLKQQFNDFRNQTPKHVQWLLLGAAFLIVVILLTMLLIQRKKPEPVKDLNIDLQYTPTAIDFGNVSVGDSKEQSVEISADINILIDDINIPEPDSKNFIIGEDCTGRPLTKPCTINVEYSPEKAYQKTNTEMVIKWHIENQEDQKEKRVNITYSANEVHEKKPVLPPVKVNANLQYNPTSVKFNNVLVGETESEYIEMAENPDIFIDDVNIAETDSFELGTDCDGQLNKSCTITVTYIPEKEQSKNKTEIIITWHTTAEAEIKEKNIPVSYSAKELVKNPFPESEPMPSEKCSEFAIPGYDTSGRQIGWIKPTGGANYFHPFSDKDCLNPTGKYDFSTGIITSLSDGSKIGTDSDHIGYRNVRDRNLSVPHLSSPQTNVARADAEGKFENATWLSDLGLEADKTYDKTKHKSFPFGSAKTSKWDEKLFKPSTPEGEYIASTQAYDRTFILRQFKPIPATIVSEVRADPSVYGCNKAGQDCKQNKNYSIPVRATVDRNVYSDDGRTIILPTGTLLMGYLSGELPGPYQAFGRMNIKWYQFIRPDGIEFNFQNDDQDPYSADAQGRMGVPGHGSTDYVEQMVMPILTALVPAAVNMIAPITDTVINQIDLDNNTIVQSGTIRSSEMAKQDIINTWNKITQKLLVDAIDNTVPPFSIAAGTRINVFSPVDLVVTCGDPESGKKCAVVEYGAKRNRTWSDLKKQITDASDTNKAAWQGQIRSFNLNKYCTEKNGKITIQDGADWVESGYDYRTVLAYCEAQNYQAINNAKNAAYSDNVKQQAKNKQLEYGIDGYKWDETEGLQTDTSSQTPEQLQKYNTEVLGLQYDEDGNILNPFAKPSNAVAQEQDEGLTCEGGATPDANGCCAGETYTDMGESYVDENGSHFACCPSDGGDCFPPIEIE